MEAINSVSSQEKGDVELIIVDDGSTDETKTEIQQLKLSFLKYIFQDNQGQSAARNQGVEKAKGEYVIFMDDDDYWLEGFLDNFRSAIQNSTKAQKIFRTGFIRVYKDGKERKAPNYDAKIDGHPVKWAAYNMCGLWSLCIPREYLMEHQSPVGFPHWQDTHLILRLLAQYPFEQLDVYNYGYRIHERMGSLRSENKKDLLNRAKINVKAMDHLFENYGNLVSIYLPSGTSAYLKAEKYLGYANLELTNGSRSNHWELLKCSLRTRVDFRFWKGYLIFFRNVLFR